MNHKRKHLFVWPENWREEIEDKVTLDYETPLPPKDKVEKPSKQEYFAELDAIDAEIEEKRQEQQDLVRKIRLLSSNLE